MSATISEVDEGDLPSTFRDGLRALRDAHPKAAVEPLIEKGNMVVVRLGTFDVSGDRFTEDRDNAPLDHAYDEYEVFARLPRNFPTGNVKGFGTSPPLKREDGSAIKNNPDWTPAIQEDHEAFHDGDHGVEWYSWNWEGFPTSEPKHMKFAYDSAHQMLIHG